VLPLAAPARWIVADAFDSLFVLVIRMFVMSAMHRHLQIMADASGSYSHLRLLFFVKYNVSDHVSPHHHFFI